MTDLVVQVFASVQWPRFARRWLTCGMRRKRGRRMCAPRRLPTVIPRRSQITDRPDSRLCNLQSLSACGFAPASNRAGGVPPVSRSDWARAAFPIDKFWPLPVSAACPRYGAASRANLAESKKPRRAPCRSPSGDRSQVRDQSCRSLSGNSDCRIHLRRRTRHTARSTIASRRSDCSTT